LVLDDQGAAILDIIKQALVVGAQSRASRVGTNAQDNRAVFSQVCTFKILIAQEVNIHADVGKCLGYVASRANDVTDIEVRSKLDIHSGNSVVGFLVIIIRTYALVTRDKIALAIGISVVTANRGQMIDLVAHYLA